MSNSTKSPIRMNRVWEVSPEGNLQHVYRLNGNNGEYVLFSRFEKTGKTNRRTGREVYNEVRVLHITRLDGSVEVHEFDTVTHAKTVIAADIEMFA